uniref:Uncharacterized protein n=1 Tax=Spironucleus salmonicida TaxID=348837 RepID=V6LSG8_9EUKA|eukprot:EST47550.1 Hypothetical protein SS50377_12533 [Spironucleus salmonicida]
MKLFDPAKDNLFGFYKNDTSRNLVQREDTDFFKYSIWCLKILSEQRKIVNIQTGFQNSDYLPNQTLVKKPLVGQQDFFLDRRALSYWGQYQQQYQLFILERNAEKDNKALMQNWNIYNFKFYHDEFSIQVLFIQQQTKQISTLRFKQICTKHILFILLQIINKRLQK